MYNEHSFYNYLLKKVYDFSRTNHQTGKPIQIEVLKHKQDYFFVVVKQQQFVCRHHSDIKAEKVVDSSKSLLVDRFDWYANWRERLHFIGMIQKRRLKCTPKQFQI